MNKKNFSLKTIGIEITWNCNQRCSYCYLACSNLKNKPDFEMNLKTFKQTLDKIWDSGIREVYLIGGEPTVHSKFEKIVAILLKYKWKKIGLCTNGVGISTETQKLIKESFDYVSVSIRGDSTTTAKITSLLNSFNETIEFLKYLSENKRNQIYIGLDLLPQYLKQFKSIMRLLERKEILFDKIEIHRIAPIGKAQDKNVLSIEQYRNLLAEIDNVFEGRNSEIAFEDALPLCLFEEKYWKYINTCRCGIDKIWIDPYGNVRRCACSLGIIGNVIESSLEDVWNCKKLLKFRSFDWVSTECKKCSVFDKCHGGCPSSRGVVYYKSDRFSDYFKAL